MATVSSVLVLNDKMTKTLESIEKATKKLEDSMDSADKGVKKLDDTMGRATSSSGGFLKSLLGFQAVKSIFSMVTSQLGDAIGRFDTLNNYTKVMSNLGISEADANKSLERMKTALDGLPTTLQDGAMAVQRFTSANGNVQASTEMFLALNNAILAGGGNAVTQASALEQLSQAYAKGKPDMMEWRTAMSAMPAQLKQVATAMGFVSADALGESLRTGKTSMNEFMQTLVQMNNEGVDGFKSLDEQARNATGGIQTSITNFKTAITKGIESMIRTINTTLEKSGLPTIQQMIQTAGKKIQQILTKTGQIIGKTISFVVKNWQVLKPLLINLIALLTTYKLIVGAITLAETIYNGVKAIATAMNSALAASVWAVLAPLLIVVAIIAAIILAVHLVIKIINEATGSTISTVGVIMAYLNMLKAYIYNRYIVPVWNMIANLVNFFANCFKDPVQSIKILFLEMATDVLGYFQNMLKGVEDFLNAMIDGINQVANTSIGHINVAETTKGLINDLNQTKNSLKAEMGWEDVVQKLDYMDYTDAAAAGYNWGANFGKGLEDAANLEDALGDLGDIDWDSLNDSIGTDSTGGKAVKTTTNDNLLSDEDIQLLLDVATRDYKLNYQKVEPNITITFGDVRETADVDTIMDVIADKLEEIYDGNLEVVKE